MGNIGPASSMKPYLLRAGGSTLPLSLRLGLGVSLIKVVITLVVGAVTLSHRRAGRIRPVGRRWWLHAIDGRDHLHAMMFAIRVAAVGAIIARPAMKVA